MKNYPKDRSPTISQLTINKLKQRQYFPKKSENLITDIELQILKKPRQPLNVIEPIIRAYFLKLYQQHYQQSGLYKNMSLQDFDKMVLVGLNEFIHGPYFGVRAKIVKRDRLRFFAKAISNGRVKSLDDCFHISDACTHLSFVKRTQGMVGFVLDNLALLHLLLSFSRRTLERFSASFASLILGFIGHSLVGLVGGLQIFSIIKENKPLQPKHYAQIAFIASMTMLGMIGYCTGNGYFSIISSSLAICRNILILGNELKGYFGSEPGSDKQRAHKQACFDCITEVILSALAVTITAGIILMPMPGATLTAVLVAIIAAKIIWQFIPSATRMSIKHELGFGKKEYAEILGKPSGHDQVDGVTISLLDSNMKSST